MEKENQIQKPLNSKGAAIFKKILDDKKALREHIQKAEKLKISK